MLTRGCKISIENKSSVIFYRRMHNITNGTWQHLLAEKLEPGKVISFEGSTPKQFQKFRGTVQYACSIHGADVILFVEFVDSWIEGTKFKTGIRVDFSSSLKLENAEIPDDIFEVSSKNEAKNLCQISLRESRTGKVYLEGLHKQLREALLKTAGRFPSGLIPYEALLHLPKHFTRNVKNIGWRTRMKETYRSIRICIVNFTKYTLKLIKEGGLSVHLQEGKWVEFPSEEIPPVCYTEFGCKAKGALQSILGRCCYYVVSHGSLIDVKWNHPGLLAMKCEATHSVSKFLIPKFMEQLNEGTCRFYIIDSSEPLSLRLLRARDIPSEKILKTGIGVLTQNFLKSAIFEDDLTNRVLDYASNEDSYMENADWEDTLGSENNESLEYCGMLHRENRIVKLCIRSPRAFFWSIVDHALTTFEVNKLPSRYTLPRVSIQPDSYLYLQWQIGCEIYGGIYGPDELVSLNSVIPGGREDGLYKQGKLWDYKSIQPLEIINRILDTNLIPHIDGLLDRKKAGVWRHLQHPEEQPRRVLLAFDCLKAVNDAFNRVVVAQYSNKYGTNWAKELSIPSYQFWPNKQYDLQCLIDLILADFSLFPKLTSGKEYLINIQEGAIFWGSQLLDKFTYEFVFRLVESAKQILTLLNFHSYTQTVNNVLSELKLSKMDSDATEPAG